MSKIKKLIALTLALAMVLSVSAFAGNYSENTYADADKINADCEDAVELLYALDIMVGDGKNFNPESAVTRAEMAKMIYVILNYGKDDKAVTYTGAKFFTDVEAGYWAEGYINYCASTKLIAGRGDGTFGPTDAVTTAEAAKMLLTAIGYSAEARGYTGANWDKNVLNDAAILGLLEGYKSNVNLVAPRQWVAVMFQNALLNCFTFDTMYPSFNGLLVSGSEESKFLKFGKKYYGLDEYVGYLYATPNAWIDVVYTDVDTNGDADEWYVPSTGKVTSSLTGDFSTASGYVMFADGDKNDMLVIKSSVVGAQDLGQEFRVIYKAGTNTIYSVALTGESVVGEDMVKDITAEVVHKNYDNEQNNRYEFTVGDFTGKFNSARINVAEFWSNGEFHLSTPSATEVYNGIGEITKTDIVKVIDRDGDGDIEYALYTAYDYGKVTTAKNQKYHGDYVVITKLVNGEAVKYDNDTKLYIDEVINCEDKLAKNDYVKYTWNFDDSCYDVEVMEVVTANYDFKSKGGVYTFDGEDYLIADNGTAARDLEDQKKDEEYNILTDDNLLVKVWQDDEYMTLEDLNGKLALVIGLTTRYDTGFYSDTNAIRFMTIAGGNEYVDAPYYMDEDLEEDEGSAAMTWAELVKAFGFEKECDLTTYANTKGEAQLYILHTLKSGKVWLEKLEDAAVIADTEDDLVYDLTNYETAGKLNITDAVIGAKDVAVGNTFFVGIEDDGDVEYKVMTLEELGDVTASLLHSEFILDDGVIDEVLGGYALINGTKLNGDGATGYAWIVDDIRTGGYYNNKIYTDLLTPADLMEDVRVKAAADTELEEGGLYWYEYDLDNEYYVLTAVEFAFNPDDAYDTTKGASEIAKITSSSIIYEAWNSTGTGIDEDYFTKKVKDYPVALYIELYERDSNDALEDVNVTVLFTTMADLADGIVTIDTEEIGEIAVKVVNNATIEDTFTVKTDSGIIDTEDEELALIEIKIVEVTKQ